jgi:23S rRNA pseudouridine1911/1915/1917 synthase
MTEPFKNESEANSSFILHPLSEDAGKRLDVFLTEKVENWSRSHLQKMVFDGDILVNQVQVKPSYKVKEGDEIEIEQVKLPIQEFAAEDIPLNIVYEDEFLAVINKPAGMIVHPGVGVSSGTLANAIAFHFNFDLNERIYDTPEFPTNRLKLPKRIGIVHRLDKNTSGLIVVSKNQMIHEKLSEQFRGRIVKKSYLALVHGEIENNSGKIETFMGRDRFNRLKMRVTTQGRNALSLWNVKQRFEKFTLLKVEIKTGRTHQIRVHLAYLNHPIVGDELYNEGRDNTVANTEIRRSIQGLNRFFLHAEKLSFTHPATNEKMSFRSPLPTELSEFLELL